ncbi:transcription repressor OFP1-like [Musa acuminata AAA Group]|uniref:Transcription repressor n=1 Tax=Musa acuminata subsp. malaccensis TaxID=214687 RepID=A0A804KS59_MUSAM|nr:PREDICTED: transcription repressor OFP1-like [Musa acuminata subsp. malaccensis]CAG1852492.1 unnamed protein product [Musa acuminata subsp. malaccensis]
MGNYRFRLLDMIANACFYKLKHTGQRAHKNSMGRGQPPRAAATTTPVHFSPPEPKLLPNRASHYYSSRAEADRFSFSPTRSKVLDTHFPVEPARKSKKCVRRKPIRAAPTKPKLAASSVPEFPAVASPVTPPYQLDLYIDGDNHEFQGIHAGDRFKSEDASSWPHSRSCRVTSSATDVIVEVDTNSSTTQTQKKLDEFDSVSELKLRPIITKPATSEAEQSKKQAKRSSPGLHRFPMRANSPRLARKKVQAQLGQRCGGTEAAAALERKGFLESFAVVKSSSDPGRDFRDSMVEMIVENNIRASKDLEELLACYLLLNSNEYHDVIVKAFEQIWFDLAEVKLRNRRKEWLKDHSLNGCTMS